MTIFRRTRRPRHLALPVISMALAGATGSAWAQTHETAALAISLDEVNTMWLCLAAFLVFFMQAGFALVECGMTRAKNAANILMKNIMDFAVGSIVFWVVGFGVMFGVSAGLIGSNSFAFDPTALMGGQTLAATKGWSESFSWGFFLFQTAFAGTAATIVSGAMAERTKFSTYLVFSALMTAVIYPVFGGWAWGSMFLGQGWLEKLGFHDFAGSSVVHSLGGWAALAGAMVVGPRLGRFRGKNVMAMPGHNLAVATLGVFILWLGWFGFNPGSTLTVSGGKFALIAVNTNMAAAAGGLAATMLSWLWFKRSDPTFVLNGVLGGLVAVTAGCDVYSAFSSLIVGLSAGLVVVGAVIMFDRLQVDDPVGAVSVHGVCGLWGTLAVGVFATDKGLLAGGGGGLLAVQAVGAMTAAVWGFGASYLLFQLLKATLGVRVGREDEVSGLDLSEHGVEAYPEFLPGGPVTSQHDPDVNQTPAGYPVPALSK